MNDDREPTFYQKLAWKLVTVRKAHRCATCDLQIEVGMKARKHVYVDDDRNFRSEYNHVYDCWEDRWSPPANEDEPMESETKYAPSYR